MERLHWNLACLHFRKPLITWQDMRPSGHLERAILFGYLNKWKIDRQGIKRRGYLIGEQWTIIAMDLLVGRALQGNIGSQLYHHILLSEHPVEYTQNDGIGEDLLVGERWNPGKGDIVPGLLAGP